MALVLYLTWHRSRSPFGLPVILIGGVIAAHVAFWLAGISLAEAQAVGLDLSAAAARHLHAAVERDRNRPLSLARAAGSARAI